MNGYYSNFQIPYGFNTFVDMLNQHYSLLIGMDRFERAVSKELIAKKVAEVRKAEEAADEIALELVVEEALEKLHEEYIKEKKDRKTDRKRKQRQKRKLKKQAQNNEEREADANIEDEVEEEIDLNSAFVSKSAEKLLNKQGALKNDTVQKKDKNQDLNTAKLPFASQPHPVTVLAFKGFNLARDGRFNEAIDAFTEAITLTPNDYRLYSNRCLCYIQIREYKIALRDAEDCLKYNPDYSKGYLNMGEAHLGLNDFNSAEEAFEKALKLDPKCQEAMHDLFFIQMKKLTDMGFAREKATSALKSMKTLNAAIEYLLNNNDADAVNEHNSTRDSEIFQSDEENYFDNDRSIDNDTNSVSGAGSVYSSAVASESTVKTETEAVDPFIDFRNPYHCTKLYIGNVSPRISAKYLEDTFSQYGNVISAKLLPACKCAFVTFKDWKSAAAVMEKLQNWSLMPGTPPVTIKYPTSDLHRLSGGLIPLNDIRPKLKTDQNSSYRNHVERDNWCSQTMPPSSPAPSLTSVRSTYSQAVLRSPQKKSKNLLTTGSDHPVSCGSLYIGNIVCKVKEKDLLQVFSKFGQVVSVRIIPEKKCAFVNYANTNSAALAMNRLQGKVIFPSHPPILIKYPTKAIKTVDPNASNGKGGQVLGDECYNWRTLGCNLGKSCPNKHITEHRGIALRHKAKFAS